MYSPARFIHLHELKPIVKAIFFTPIETPPKYGFWTLQQNLQATKIVNNLFFSWCAEIERNHWVPNQGCIRWSIDLTTIWFKVILLRFGSSLRTLYCCFSRDNMHRIMIRRLWRSLRLFVKLRLYFWHSPASSVEDPENNHRGTVVRSQRNHTSWLKHSISQRSDRRTEGKILYQAIFAP